MGYNAIYGQRNLDSTYREPVKSVDRETLNFLETDELGILHVQREFVHCDVCGRKIDIKENVYVHGSYEYCEQCEELHQRNEEYIKQRKTKKTKKAVKK